MSTSQQFNNIINSDVSTIARLGQAIDKPCFVFRSNIVSHANKYCVRTILEGFSQRGPEGVSSELSRRVFPQIPKQSARIQDCQTGFCRASSGATVCISCLKLRKASAGEC